MHTFSSPSCSKPSIPPPPPVPSDVLKARSKTVQRIAPTGSTNCNGANTKEVQNFQRFSALRGDQNDADACSFATGNAAKGDVNRKSSVGSGICSGVSASTAADGEWSSERLQDVGSDQVSEAGTAASNEDYQATAKDLPEFFVKLLVSNQLAGMLIGTSGQEIKALKEKTGAKVMLSPHGRFFPGTSERLVILEGTQESVLNAMEWIVDKILEIPPPVDPGNTNKPACRICVPRAVIGSLIGKNGSYIQYVRMTTGAHVHVSPLFVSADEACAERVVTIQTRDRESLRSATFTVLKKINEHPSNATCRNISYLKNPVSLSEATPPVGSMALSSDTSSLTQSQGGLSVVSNDSLPGGTNDNNVTDSLNDNKSEQSSTQTPTLSPSFLQSSSLSSSPTPVRVVLGPPPGLGGIRARMSPNVPRGSWDTAQPNDARNTVAAALRAYSRELSAETESTQCSLALNHGGANVSSVNRLIKHANFPMFPKADEKKKGIITLRNRESPINSGRTFFNRNVTNTSGGGENLENNRLKLKEESDATSEYSSSLEQDADDVSENAEETEGNFVKRWLMNWVQESQTIQLSRIIQGWAVTITIAFGYYMLMMWLAGDK